MLNLLILLSLLFAGSSCFISPCEVGRQQRLLMAEEGWSLQSAFKDGVNDTSFNTLTVKFSITNYSTNLLCNSVWPAEGQYHFENELSSVIIRDDGNEFMIVESGETHLVLKTQFTLVESISARSASSRYTFSFYRPR